VLMRHFSARAMNLGSALGTNLIRAMHSSFNSSGENFPGGFSLFKKSPTGLPYPNIMNESSGAIS